MSNLASNGDDYPEAARKHLDDAAALAQATRFDGSAYLAGYVVECALKTLVLVARMGEDGLPTASRAARRLGHDLDGLTRHALELAALPSSATAPYAPPTTSLADEWRPERRYAAPGVRREVAERWLREATEFYDATLVRLRLDGVVQ